MPKASAKSHQNTPSKYQSLEGWLAWQTTLHAREIELGLDRIREVAGRLDLIDSPFLVITVAGTNGKGSTVAILSTILHHAGYKVGTYTSPHIVRYNERIRVGLRCVSDKQLCESFAKIDAARGDISLSFFEFATLAALEIFHKEKVDVAVLEVGLGGRLDATNLVDCDLALITSIGIDHTEWLGNSRESIAFEKAGIFRPDIPAVCGDEKPPATIAEVAADKGTQLFQLNTDFNYEVAQSSWSFFTDGYELQGLPLPSLSGAVQIKNAANALMGLYCIRDKLPISFEAIETGLREVILEGRFQRMVKDCEIIFDVAHNYDSASVLAENLLALPRPLKTTAVFSVLNDKDLKGIVEIMHSHVDQWYISEVNSHRAMAVAEVEQELTRYFPKSAIKTFPTIEQAYSQAQNVSNKGDRILVFGSIFTVAEVLTAEN